MENASKALLMAGGILIAIIILAVLIQMFNNVGMFQRTQLSEKEQEQLVAFNEQYTKYLNQYVYGTEVITVVNKSLNNTSYTIKTTIRFSERYTYSKKEWDRSGKKYENKEYTVDAGSTLNITNKAGKTDDVAYDIIENPSDDLKRRAFKCTAIGYDNQGRVNSITFEEKKWGNLT